MSGPLPSAIDPLTDRRNGNLFLIAFSLIYFAAPIIYVGVVQAALCNKLGASATVANLPMAAWTFGCFAPIVLAGFVPYRWERGVVVAVNLIQAALVGLVGLALMLPLSNKTQLTVSVSQALLMGILTSVNRIFILQCLGRGTTELGRGRAFKITWTFGPLAAVAGSLAAQFILRGGFPGLVFPKDFGLLYLIGVPCSLLIAWFCSKFELPPLEEKPRAPFFSALWEGILVTVKSPPMLLLWFGYLFWYCTLLAMPNLSLYAKKAMGRDPAEFSGLMMAIRFGCKCVGGYVLGVLNIRYGVRAPLIVTTSLLGLAVLWAWVVPGYAYLAAFGFMGAGELGGSYFPNVLLSWSPSVTATRDMSVLNLATPAATLSPALHGFLTDHWGFPASFALGIATALIALVIVLRLPIKKRDS